MDACTNRQRLGKLIDNQILKTIYDADDFLGICEVTPWLGGKLAERGETVCKNSDNATIWIIQGRAIHNFEVYTNLVLSWIVAGEWQKLIAD